MADIQLKVKQVRLVEKLRKHGFQCNTEELFEPITNADTYTSQNLFQETKSTTKAIEELHEPNVHVKALELMNKNGVTDSSLIRPKAKLLVPTNRSQFRFYDDPDSDNWNDYVTIGKKFQNAMVSLF